MIHSPILVGQGAILRCAVLLPGQVAVRVTGQVCPTATPTAFTAHPERGVTRSTKPHPLPAYKQTHTNRTICNTNWLDWCPPPMKNKSLNTAAIQTASVNQMSEIIVCHINQPIQTTSHPHLSRGLCSGSLHSQQTPETLHSSQDTDSPQTQEHCSSHPNVMYIIVYTLPTPLRNTAAVYIH